MLLLLAVVLAALPATRGDMYLVMKEVRGFH
jgi:hypothetical protein